MTHSTKLLAAALLIALAGCTGETEQGRASAPAPVEAVAPQELDGTPATPQGAADADAAVDGDTDTAAPADEATREVALKETAPWMQPVLARGLEVACPDALRLSVNPATGAATVAETDLLIGSLALRRTRTQGFAAPGLFGRGWVSELETVVRPGADGSYVVRRVLGLVELTPAGDDLWVTERGEVEVLYRDGEGAFHLASATGRRYDFDAQGRLAAVEPGYTVAWSDDAVEVTGDVLSVRLPLDAEGRVTAALAGGEAELT